MLINGVVILEPKIASLTTLEWSAMLGYHYKYELVIMNGS